MAEQFEVFNAIVSDVFVDLVTYFETHKTITKDEFNHLVTKHQVIQFKKHNIKERAIDV